MPYPYKKMTQEDFDKIIEITDNERVWVGDEIAKEYYRMRCRSTEFFLRSFMWRF